MQEFIIRYWIEFLFSGLITVLSYSMMKISQQFKKEVKDQKSIKIGIQAILRDRLIQSYNKHTREGFCSIHDRDNMTNMYEQYHGLGENGVMDGLYDEVMSLPVRDDC